VASRKYSHRIDLCGHDYVSCAPRRALSESFFRRWRWPIIWLAVILTLTSIPGRDVPQVPLFPEADKVVHLTMYAVLGALVSASVGGRGVSVGRVIVAIAVFAAFDEWHQQFIPGRTMDVMDWLADVIGCLLGLIFLAVARRRRERTS
jgi:VanZ family protein